MLSKGRPRLTYANVASTLALILATGGGAYAAASSIPGPNGVIHGCYRKTGGALRLVAAGARCSKPERAIAFNQRGVPGPAGGFSRKLSSGETVSGTWAIDGLAGKPPGGIDGTGSSAVSFGFELPSPPTPHIIKVGEAVPGGCSGNFEHPGAAPGNLCIFESFAFHRENLELCPWFGCLSTSGAVIIAAATNEGVWDSVGTWAVTAA
jgi:hypothetical protein